MAKSIAEYITWLDERQDLIWPKPPAPRPLKATPYLKPLPGVRAVAYEVYGTLLRIDGGRLQHIHPQQLRMQIALEKTIEEFRMWYSMSRKPGQPWEYLLQQYTTLIEEDRLKPTKRKGDAREVSSPHIWRRWIDRLVKNEYQYEESFYGDPDDLALKVAYFFHASLQGTAAAEHARDVLAQVSSAGLLQGVICDGQPFTPAQLLRDLQRESPMTSLSEVLSPGCTTVSAEMGVCKPSPSLFATGLAAFTKRGVDPGEILYVSHRIDDDIAAIRSFGVRTALLATDAECCRVTADELRDPDRKPDRLLTDLRQISQILRI
ncbi:MAG: HAD family hydrolase [Planctomycetota bacterium]|nr:MAG: HAD family hydrolase [Planctomycetota bacterium]REJ94677.1 MAG: HAD family hydrolase [Planctomycetota bacterium]REK31363.1 MAG: HAD family hydrolase [Planctomycetota bacterium]REK39088.1 MAG: HAD family hydrolase [Planctomycetota bacterium]